MNSLLETIILLSGLVIDTFIITSVNGCTLKENIRSYLGIETLFSIFGVLIGSIVLFFVSKDFFKCFCGVLIIIIQIIGISGVKFPEKVNALLLGSDSLVIFATLSWIYIPILTVFEAIAITLGSTEGSNVMKYVPEAVAEYLPHFVMIMIGLMMIWPCIF